MKRLILGILGVIFAFLVVSKPAYANEGVLNLRGIGAGRCYGVSVYIDGTYKMLLTCRELITALSPEKNRYVAWVEGEDGKQKRLGEIVNGKLSTITDIKFTKVFVTSENDGYGNKPLGDMILTATIEPIDFGKVIPTPAIITPTPTQANSKVTSKTTVTPKPTASSEPSTSGLGSALSTIFKIALFGFGLLLVVVGVFSFLQRRRSL